MSSAGLPRQFNAPAHFVDRHVREGRGGRTALVFDEGRSRFLAVHVGHDRRAQSGRVWVSPNGALAGA